MSFRSPLSFCRWLVLSLSVALSAKSTPPTDPSSAAIKQARALLEKEIVPKVPGAAVAVAVNGTLVWSESFGRANLTTAAPVTTETRFRIGSVSKPLTSVGLALLIERGQLDWDAPIQRYIPDYPRQVAPITLRLLTGHLSGIRDYRHGEALSNARYADTRSRLKVFERDPLVAPPGTQFSYASYNWDVIAVAIERATRQDFRTYMEANVLGPLHLTHTRAEETGAHPADQTEFYEANQNGAMVLGPLIDNRYAWASRGYLSTAEDLVHFGSALLRPGFLKASSLHTLFASQTTADGQATGYGAGWYVYPKPRVIYHTGETVGGLCILLMLPENNTVVAILTNRGSLNVPSTSPLYFNLETIGYQVARLFGPSTTDLAAEKN